MAYDVDQLAKAADRLGIAVNDLSAWGRLVRHQGGTEQELTAWFDQLQGMVANLRINPEMLEGLAMGGVDPNVFMAERDPHQTAMMLSRIFQANAGDPQAIRRLQDAVGATGAISDVLKGGPSAISAGLEDEKRRLSISKELTVATREFNEQMQNLGTNLADIGYGIATYVLPPITAAVKGLNMLKEAPGEVGQSILDLAPEAFANAPPVTASGIPIGASAAPQGVATQGDVWLDGEKLGKWMRKMNERMLTLEVGGATGTQ
jgi:hypothetical protein